MSLKQTGLRLAALHAFADIVNGEYKTARTEAAGQFAELYTEQGIDRMAVVLPGGTKVASITIKQGTVTADVDDDALLAWVTEHTPTEVEEVIDPAAATDPEILALIREHRPDVIRRRVRPLWRETKVAEAKANDGYVVHPVTGEAAKVAEVTRHAPTGEFQLKPDRSMRGEVLDALRYGDLARIAGIADVLPLPALPGEADTTGELNALTRADEDTARADEAYDATASAI